MENKEMSQDKDNKIIKSCREALRERARRANVKKALRFLDKAGTEDPRPGDEMPDEKRAHIDQALDSMLRKAIRSKHLIRFSYKNQERIAEPHDYGIQNGIARLFCYQVEGRSGGRIPGWRLVNVSECKIAKCCSKLLLETVKPRRANTITGMSFSSGLKHRKHDSSRLVV